MVKDESSKLAPQGTKCDSTPHTWVRKPASVIWHKPIPASLAFEEGLHTLGETYGAPGIQVLQADGYTRETEILVGQEDEWLLTWFKKVENVKDKIYNKKRK